MHRINGAGELDKNAANEVKRVGEELEGNIGCPFIRSKCFGKSLISYKETSKGDKPGGHNYSA
jgi:hypothetical protein